MHLCPSNWDTKFSRMLISKAALMINNLNLFKSSLPNSHWKNPQAIEMSQQFYSAHKFLSLIQQGNKEAIDKSGYLWEHKVRTSSHLILKDERAKCSFGNWWNFDHLQSGFDSQHRCVRLLPLLKASLLYRGITTEY